MTLKLNEDLGKSVIIDVSKSLLETKLHIRLHEWIEQSTKIEPTETIIKLMKAKDVTMETVVKYLTKCIPLYERLFIKKLSVLIDDRYYTFHFQWNIFKFGKCYQVTSYKNNNSEVYGYIFLDGDPFSY